MLVVQLLAQRATLSRMQHCGHLNLQTKTPCVSFQSTSTFYLLGCYFANLNSHTLLTFALWSRSAAPTCPLSQTLTCYYSFRRTQPDHAEQAPHDPVVCFNHLTVGRLRPGSRPQNLIRSKLHTSHPNINLWTTFEKSTSTFI